MKKKIFISYSHDSVEHKDWVHMLADELEQYKELHIVFDQYDLGPLEDKNKFMEDAVFDTEIILIIATENYAVKANQRKGGAGIETSLATSRHWEENEENSSSNIIIIKRGRQQSSIPNYLKNKIYIDFSNNNYFNDSFKNLVESISDSYKSTRPHKKKALTMK